MIKKYIDCVKKFINTSSSPKFLTFLLFILMLLRNIVLLLIPFSTSKIIENLNILNYKFSLTYSLIFFIFGFVYVVLFHYSYVVYTKTASYIHNSLQKSIMNKVSKYDFNYDKKISSAYIINTGFEDIGKVQQFPYDLFCALISIISIFISIIILINVNIYIGLVTTLLSIFTIYIILKNMNLRDYYLDGQRKYQDNISSFTSQIVDGVKEIKSYNMESSVGDFLDNNIIGWNKNYNLKRKYQANVFVLIPTILGYGKIIIYLFLIFLVLRGKYELSLLILVIGYFESVQNNIATFYTNLELISANSTRINRIDNVLNYKIKNNINGDKSDIEDFSIKFKNVYFKYNKNIILENINFEIEPNTFNSIVGLSGSGKSTIFKLLLRDYKISDGEILLGNKNIYEYTNETICNTIAFANQNPFIFEMSIKDNLDLIDSNKDNQIKVCKMLGLHNYIINLKDGYNTKLIDNATNIPELERQLLIIARIILSNPKIILFDEIASSLNKSELKIIINILKKLKNKYTIIIITYNLELMKLSDKIILLSDGVLTNICSYKEFLNNKYNKLFK